MLCAGADVQQSRNGAQCHCLKFRLGSAGEPTICSHCYDVLNEDWSYSPETLNSGKKSSIFRTVWPWNWQMTPKNYRAPLLCHVKLCASFCSYLWFQTGVTVKKCPIWVKFINFTTRVTLKFDGQPWKTIGHLFEPTSSFGHHFIALLTFTPKLGQNLFWSVTLTFHLWPWWTSLQSMVITPENFTMIGWQEHCLSCDRRTGRQNPS